MFKDAVFLRSILSREQIPSDNFPVVAVCGRSNVGKSSFLNSLFNKQNLAKVSSTPGKTRAVNYFTIDSSWYAADLPGFGFAKVSKAEQEKWAAIVSEFFSSAKNIRLVLHLVDSRFEPAELDKTFHKFLVMHKLPFVIILTKIDKLNQSKRATCVKSVLSVFPELANQDTIFLHSAVTGSGLRPICEKILSVIKKKLD